MHLYRQIPYGVHRRPDYLSGPYQFYSTSSTLNPRTVQNFYIPPLPRLAHLRAQHDFTYFVPHPANVCTPILNPPIRSELPHWEPPQAASRASLMQQRSLWPTGILHPSIASRTRTLHWDINDSLLFGRHIPRTTNLPDVRDAVIWPECVKVEIIYDHPYTGPLASSFGPIVVYARGEYGVKIEDLINAIYLHFRNPLSDNDWSNASPEERHLIERAYASRIRTFHDQGTSPRYVRADALRGFTQFAGLRVQSSLGNTCILHLDLMLS